jgi:hypothetical protein
MSSGQGPKDDENTIYIESKYSDYSFAELWEKISAKWPDARLKELSFKATSEKASGCGCHPSPSDYEPFIKITRDRK